MFKKGLISLAAASLVTSSAYASSSIASGTPVSYFSGVNPVVTIGADFNVTEDTGTITSGTFVKVHVTIPSTLKLNTTVIGSSASNVGMSDFNVSGSMFTSSTKNVYITADGNLTMDYNSSDDIVIIDGTTNDFNSTYNLGPSATLFDETASNDSATGPQTVGTYTVNGEAFTFNFLLKDNGNPLTVSLQGMKLAPASSTTSGLQSITVESNNSAHLTTGSISPVTYSATPATIVVNESVTNKNIGASGTGLFADFNITLAQNMTEVDGNITVTLAGGAIPSGNTDINVSFVNAAGVGFERNDTQEGNVTFVDLNKTIAINMAAFDNNQSVSIQGAVTTDVGVGGVVTANFSTTAAYQTGSFTSLATVGASAVTIANVVADGMTVAYADANTTTYEDRLVVAGRTDQRLEDINISEFFYTTFKSTSNANTMTFTLPSGYTFSDKPNLTMKHNNIATGASVADGDIGSGTNTKTPSPVGTNSYTVTFGTSNGEAFVDSNDSSGYLQELQLSNLYVTIPSTATAGTTVDMTISETMSATPSSSTVKMATLVDTSTTFTELNTTTPNKAAKSGVVANYAEVFDVNESFASALVAGTTISITLDNGAVFSSAGANPNIITSTGATLYGFNHNAVVAPAYSDANKTLTISIPSTSGSTTKPGMQIQLPAVSLVGTTAGQTVTATVAGTSGVVGTMTIATAVEGNTVSSTIGAIAPSSIETYTGTFKVQENLIDGLSQTGQFKLLAPAGITFTGLWKGQEDTATTATTYGTAGDGNVTTSFNTGDTLNIILQGLSDSAEENITISAQVNVAPTATAGINKFTIKDNAVSGSVSAINSTSVDLVYVGTIPTMTAAADATTVAPGATATITATDATGTVSFSSADTTIATVDATTGVVTVDANATEAATVAITATDSLTAQTASVTITVGAAAVVAPTLSGDVALGAGWNLVSSPVNGTVSSSVFNAVATQSNGTAVTWALKNDGTGYEAMGATLDLVPGRGIWVKADATATASFTGITEAASAFDLATYLATLGGTAYHTGTPTAITLGDLVTAGASQAWLFDTPNNNWIGYKKGATGAGGDTDFDTSGYFRGSAATAIGAGTGFWYLP